MNLVFGKHSPSVVPPCLHMYLVAHYATNVCACVQAPCARRRCSQLCSSSATAFLT